MDFKAFKSTEEWQEIWLHKLSCELARLGIGGDLSRFHYTIINKFLSENPGNPRMINIKRLVSFVAKEKNDTRPPLIMFYETVARSEEHLAALKSPELFPRLKRTGRPAVPGSPTYSLKKRHHDEPESAHSLAS